MATLDWWPSPAKLNLFLHILGRLPTGYHKLQSVFQLLDHGDKLAFEITDNPQLIMATALPGVPDSDNLIVRAARLLQHTSKTNFGARIHLQKVLPMGGGIGGGSSNAATTLVALNHLWQCGLSLAQLAELGLQLGADVPIFVEGNSAFAEGVGEKLLPMQLGESWYLVVFPGVHIATAEVFGAADLPRNTPPIAPADYHFDNTHNDCQAWVCKTYPQVANLLQWLLEYAPSRMTGSGACVFARCQSREQAELLLKQLPEGCSGFVARGVDQSPLHAKLSTQNCRSKGCETSQR